MASEQFSLCWDNFHKNMSSGMNSLLENEDLVDVTLAVQGKCLKAHKMVLSVCSPYFKELFKSNPCQHPIVFMKDVSFEALSDLLQFMYQGEVQVSQENLTTFIKTAEALQIKGLTGDGNGSADAETVEPLEKPAHPIEEYRPAPRPKKQQLTSIPTTPSVKRPRLSASSDSLPLPPTITKTEPVIPVQPVGITPEPAIQFKMEPYDQNQSLLDETGDDNFGDDNLDDTTADDNEDYSMMESGVGEEEPQAGTSTDGAGEGQALIYKTTPEDEESESIILDRYEFRMEKKSSKTSWRCIRSSCRARFVTFDDIVEIKERIQHNHDPTFDGSLDECSVEIIEIRLDPSVNAAGGKINLMNNGDDSESSTGKSNNVGQPLKAAQSHKAGQPNKAGELLKADQRPKAGTVGKKREPEIVVMGVDALKESRFRRRGSDTKKARYSAVRMERSQSSKRSDSSSPQLGEDDGASSKDTGKQFSKRVSTGFTSGRIARKKYYE